MRQVVAIAAAVWVIAAAGCAGLGDFDKKESFHDITKTYAHAMRWSEFDTATIFVHQPGAAGTEALGNIKVTSYEVKKHLVVQEGTRIRQIAAISYFKKSDMLVRTVAVEEIWEFSEKDNGWFLVSGFPSFE